MIKKDKMSLATIQSSRVLLSPLNWGLGHVCRTIPIIQELIDNKNEVIICCNEEQEEYYRDFFPELWYVTIDGYPFHFSGSGKWTFDFLRNFKKLYHHLQHEKRKAEELVEKFAPDYLISDQRYGFISSKVKSCIITHQLNLPVPTWNFIAKGWNKRLLRKFDEIWVPDDADQTYSGKLSDGNFQNKHFIGIQSRFSKDKSKFTEELELKEYKHLGIVSGPPPYNQAFLNQIIEKIAKSGLKGAIIYPKGLQLPENKPSNIDFFISPQHDDFVELFRKSEIVISRSGYSTLMDLAITKNKAILIPTPGQMEQIYLAELHGNESGHYDFS